MTALEDAVRAVQNGGLVVMPTDTVYGIGTRPDDPAATARLFEAKGRPRDLELPVLVASTADAETVASFDERARGLAREFWPGPLTLVLPRTSASLGWNLGGDPGTVGVRIPDHPLARALLKGTGPAAVTSANLSGRPPIDTCEELLTAFGDAVEVYLCEQEPLRGRASTVVDLARGGPRVLRSGDISEEALLRALGLDSRP